jgi:hypothetical protein
MTGAEIYKPEDILQPEVADYVPAIVEKEVEEQPFKVRQPENTATGTSSITIKFVY